MRYIGLGRDNLRSHFVFKPRHAPPPPPPSDFVLDSSQSSFSQTKKNWPERPLPRPSTPQILTHMWNSFSSALPLKKKRPKTKVITCFFVSEKRINYVPARFTYPLAQWSVLIIDQQVKQILRHLNKGGAVGVFVANICVAFWKKTSFLMETAIEYFVKDDTWIIIFFWFFRLVKATFGTNWKV